jgi:hypothetical protein
MMDPQANIVEQLAIANALMAGAEPLDLIEYQHRAERLAELIIALHEWRAAGGFDPYSDAQFARLVRP